MKHFQFQYNTRKGVVNVKFEYSDQDNEISSISLTPAIVSVVPGKPVLIQSNGVWCFQAKHKAFARGKEVMVSDTFNNEVTEGIIARIFEVLKDNGCTENKYFH
jgi:hypothetical protein